MCRKRSLNYGVKTAILILVLLSFCKDKNSEIIKEKPMNIDVMMQANAGTVQNMGIFTVDNTQEFVYIDYLTENPYLFTASMEWIFRRGDNIQLLSYGVSLPLGFELYHTQLRSGVECPHYFHFYLLGMSGTKYQIYPGFLFLPLNSDYETAFGSFYDVSHIQENFMLVAKFSGQLDNRARVSMLNVPDSLNEKTFYVSIFAKVAHNLSLIGAP